MNGGDTYDDDYEGWDSAEDEMQDQYDASIPKHESQQPSLFRQQSYKTMDVEGIAKRQEELTSEISDIYGLSFDQAFAVLQYLNWQHQKVSEHWFDDRDQKKLRTQAGIGSPGSSFALQELELPKGSENCFICFEKVSTVLGIKRCQDFFCIYCWSEYIRTKIEDGPRVAARIACPNSSCELVVPVTMVRWLLSHFQERPALLVKQKSKKKGSMLKVKPKITPQELSKMYQKYTAMGFTNLNKFVRWCPRPGCGFATETITGNLATNVTCRCGQLFCLKCGQDQHQPVSCDTAEKWNIKNTNESENTTWIIANTKPCPKCKKPIEKNQGCNHMNCQCGASYCWVCLQDWGKHGSQTGGYYKCNKYEDDENKKAEEEKRQKARDELNKYMFYYERFANHERSERHVKVLRLRIEHTMEKLHKVKLISFNEMEFLPNALTIVEDSRIILKWSYAYGFYLNDKQERHLLEYLQQKLEENADLLHEMLETPQDQIIYDEDPKNKEFYKFKEKLTNLSTVTQNFYRNFVEGVERGLTNL